MRYIFFFYIFCLIACNSSNTNNILLGNDTEFVVLPTEKILDATLEIQQEYQSLTSTYKFSQIPFYKRIDGSDYSIYIGVLMRTKNIADFLELYPEQSFIERDSSAYKISNQQDTLLVEYLFKSYANFYYIIGKSTNENLKDTILSERDLKNRIKVNK